ncbi:MAG: AbrB/MazE/SpoVT family DNA-binding domain-containing protein [Thermoguttaceae bacterium]|nr:AbrB/MazE/SpoVT family DNA-binding domain-containing protein [Thermoguttaceae bacterium]
MKVTCKGQVTIPIEIRDRLDILPGNEVEFVEEGGHVVLRKKVASQGRGRQLIEAVRGTSTVRMTTDDIMALTRGAPTR